MTEFEKITKALVISLANITYKNGDISDLGNEVGLAIGEHLSTEEELKDFISGLKHGISLKNGTH
jgi:hypothetical protein